MAVNDEVYCTWNEAVVAYFCYGFSVFLEDRQKLWEASVRRTGRLRLDSNHHPTTFGTQLEMGVYY